MSIEITYNGVTERIETLREMGNGMGRRIKAGFTQAGRTVREMTMRNLSGPSQTNYPGNSNPFPGVVSGALRASVNFEASEQELRIGAGGAAKAYARIQEFGGMAGRGHKTRIPPRPYLFPAWESKKDEAIEAIRKAVFEVKP